MPVCGIPYPSSPRSAYKRPRDADCSPEICYPHENHLLFCRVWRHNLFAISLTLPPPSHCLRMYVCECVYPPPHIHTTAYAVADVPHIVFTVHMTLLHQRTIMHWTSQGGHNSQEGFHPAVFLNEESIHDKPHWHVRTIDREAPTCTTIGKHPTAQWQ